MLYPLSYEGGERFRWREATCRSPGERALGRRARSVGEQRFNELLRVALGLS